jgi:hypothetical protein
MKMGRHIEHQNVGIMVGADGRAVFIAHSLSPSVDERANFGFVVHEHSLAGPPELQGCACKPSHTREECGCARRRAIGRTGYGVPVPKSSECPAFRRGHWARGRPSARIVSVPSGGCGQPGGESSNRSCRP